MNKDNEKVLEEFDESFKNKIVAYTLSGETYLKDLKLYDNIKNHIKQALEAKDKQIEEAEKRGLFTNLRTAGCYSIEETKQMIEEAKRGVAVKIRNILDNTMGDIGAEIEDLYDELEKVGDYE